jgi:hypothetical protein
MKEYRKRRTSPDFSNVFSKFKNSCPSFGCKSAAQRPAVTAILQVHEQSGLCRGRRRGGLNMGKVAVKARAVLGRGEGIAQAGFVKKISAGEDVFHETVLCLRSS